MFDATRASRDHLAFGYGVHYCLGAPLAKMEADVAPRGLFEAFPGLELAVPVDQLKPQETFIVNGHQELPVTLTKA
ncbi:cytochrome P450 [Streptomyces sp. NPDC046821]|uniref:cytochrome P450 n=1 Tax=Streptomyces sp. NPDC046821 TaxID=3154702 RepID=UPI0034049149